MVAGSAWKLNAFVGRGRGEGGAEKSGLADARSRVRLIMADYLRHLTARVRAVFIEIFSAIPAGSAQIFMRRELA